MAIEGDKIEYRDLISPDGSINELISQLEQLSKTYGAMISGVKIGAKSMSISMKQLNSTTSEARAKIDEAAAAADRLERAEKELKFAMSDIGKEVAWVKAQTADVNKTTVAHARQVEALTGSYDKIQAELADNVRLWKALSDSERASADMGGQVLATISQLTSKLSELNSQLRPTVTRLTEVQKAEQKLAFLQSEEGQRLLELKRQINEITSGRKTEKAEIDKVTRAYNELTYAKSEEAVKLAELDQQRNEANRIAKLTAQINNSAEGSYNQLAAQYELNKIKLNAMSQAERNATGAGEALEAETLDLYKRMIALQEATGNHKLSVGDYAKAFNGLRFSVFQVVREIPAATINVQTFFLAISNNLPILADEIARMNAQNKAAIANGEKSVSVIKQICKAIFSWNSLLVVGVTLLIMHGKRIADWIGNLVGAKKPLASVEETLVSAEEALGEFGEKLKSTANEYADNLTTFKKLQQEWINLKDIAEKTNWLDENISKFEKLGVSISNVADAENMLIESSDEFITSLKLRAEATAAQNLATSKYAEALVEEQAIANLELKKFLANRHYATSPMNKKLNYEIVIKAQEEIDARQSRLSSLRSEADNYFERAMSSNAEADEMLRSIGLTPFNNDQKENGQNRQRDISNTIYRMSLNAKKKYEESVTEIERHEFLKRISAANSSANAKLRELDEVRRKAREYLIDEEGKYKELTDEERIMLNEIQTDAANTAVNVQAALTANLEQINKEWAIHHLEITQKELQLRLEMVKKNTEEELDIRLQLLEVEEKIALAENEKIFYGANRQRPDFIKAKYTKQKNTARAEYELTNFDREQNLMEAQFNATERNEYEITRFKLAQEIARWNKQIALAESGGLDWSQVQIDTAKETVKGLERELDKATSFTERWAEKGLGGALLERLGFDDDQISALEDAASEIADAIVESLQAIYEAEVELAEKQVELAEERVDAAQSALDAEIEARNNGYANNVATAKKELQLEKQNQLEKQRLLEEAQRKQEAVDTVMQASNLITGVSAIWATSMKLGPIAGPIIAGIVTATMFGAFLASKIKAAEATKASQAYGEGGLEILDGGSHASGNDIDLNTRNSKGKNIRAEGGEAMAIINRRSTHKYRKQLPHIIRALNSGTFEDKYLQAFKTGEMLQNYNYTNTSDVNLSTVESELTEIKKQGRRRIYTTADGTTVIIDRNVKRYIK